ncbi:MAG: hypothetical protein GY862_32605 [Gammaproteobacteria bacterium]|nr:hypothetical protein [Gammaproteobacteria bacterium]
MKFETTFLDSAITLSIQGDNSEPVLFWSGFFGILFIAGIFWLGRAITIWMHNRYGDGRPVAQIRKDLRKQYLEKRSKDIALDKKRLAAEKAKLAARSAREREKNKEKLARDMDRNLEMREIAVARADERRLRAEEKARDANKIAVELKTEIKRLQKTKARSTPKKIENANNTKPEAQQQPEAGGENAVLKVPKRFAKHHGLPLTIHFGRTSSGEDIYISFVQFCHMVLGGMTNSGKSVAFHSFITQLIENHRPDELRLFMADFKRGIELARYDGIPHLLKPPAKTVKRAINDMVFLYHEMNHRLDKYTRCGADNIQEYNSLSKTADFYIVHVIDETQDLYGAKIEVELGNDEDGEPIVMKPAMLAEEFAAKSRAAGIHIFSATQLPNATTIPQKVRANSARLALKMDSYRESTSVLGCKGAETLQGQGHCLLKFDGCLIKMRTPFVDKQMIAKSIYAAKSFDRI